MACGCRACCKVLLDTFTSTKPSAFRKMRTEQTSGNDSKFSKPFFDKTVKAQAGRSLTQTSGMSRAIMYMCTKPDTASFVNKVACLGPTHFKLRQLPECGRFWKQTDLE